jgi:hypothetical protein
MKRELTGAALAAMACLAAVPAGATTIVQGTGWQIDLILATNAPSTSSPWEFTVAPGSTAHLRATDAGTPGDLLYLFNHSGGALVQKSDFYAGATLDGPVGDPVAEAAWESGLFSKIDYLVGPGSYSLDVYGNCAEGCPGVLYVRLDDPPAAVPEPASWAMMLLGLAAIGSAMRRRRCASAAAHWPKA